jgi:hypothetical protein
MAVRQSRAPSACGKFNESLLRGIDDPDKIKSSLCVCNSIRQKNTKLELREEDELGNELIFPTSDRSVTDLYKISHEVFLINIIFYYINFLDYWNWRER